MPTFKSNPGPGKATIHTGAETEPWLVHSGDVIQDIYGEESGTCVWKIKPENWGAIPALGASHPHVSHLKFESRTIAMKPGLWEVTVSYRGIKPAWHASGAPPVYELNYGSGEEPIETHPNFETDIGGKPSAPKNGAIFVDPQGNITSDDAVGIFERFAVVNPDNADFSFAGVESYLDMNNVTWTKTWVTKNMDGINAAIPGSSHYPKITNPADDAAFPAPDFAHRNWLYIGCSSTGVRGDSARHRMTWRLSGLGGWNEAVYKGTARLG